MNRHRHYLRQWRKKKGLTQDQVIDRLAVMDDPLLPRTSATLSRYETGASIYNERVLEALAEVYETTPAELLGRDPTKNSQIYDLLDRMDPATRADALAMIGALHERRANFTPAEEPQDRLAQRKTG